MSVNINKKITFIVKTFERPHCLDMLIKSIRKFYPEVPIMVADDSKNPIPRQDVEYHVLPFDSGVSKGRNFLMNQVKTPYFVLLDDDLCFINETKIEWLLDVLENTDIDIVGGRMLEQIGARGSHAVFQIQPDKLILEGKPYGKENGVELYDIIANFFLAKTDKVKNCTWDEVFKIGGEHYDFFLSHKGKLKVALHPKVFIYHSNDRSINEYNEYRSRDQKIFTEMFMKKHGISTIKRKQRWLPIDDIKQYLCSETIETYFN